MNPLSLPAARMRLLPCFARLAVFVLLVISSVSAFAQAAPTGLGAYSYGANENYVYWNPVPGATSYKVYAGTASNGQLAAPVGTPTSTAFYHPGLAAGVRIYYKVTALYGTSESPRSVEVSAKPGSPRTGWAWAICFAGSNSVTVRWSAVATANIYRILRYEPLEGWRMVGTTNLAAFTDTTAKNGVRYLYIVRAANADTDLQDSYQVSATPGDSAPGVPDGLVAAPYSSYIYLYWNPVPGATGYVIYRGTAANGQGARPYYVNGTGTSFVDNSLPGGTTYYYRVATVDESGTSDKSGEASATTGQTWLSAPVLSAASAIDKVILNWTTIPGATFYVLYRKTGDGPWEHYQQQPNTSFNDLSVAPGYTYSYKVYPGNANGMYTESNTVSGKIGTKLLAAPFGFHVRSYTTYIQLHWNPVPGATHYNVYRGTNATTQKLFATNANPGWYDSTVTPGTRYFYRTAAVYENTEGKKSTLASGKAGSVVLPASQLAAYPLAGKANLFWDIVPGAASYHIFRQTAGGNWLMIKYALVLGGAATFGSFIDNTAVGGVQQSYVVAAVNNDGTGTNSNIVTVIPGNPPPPAPRGVWTYNGGTYLTMYVDPVLGASSYNVYRTQTPGSYPLMPYKVGVWTSFTDYNVTPGQTYYYRWTAVDQDGQSDFSPETSGTPGGTVPTAPIVTLNTTAAANNLAWSAPVGATKYMIFRAPQNYGYTLLAIDHASNSYSDTAVTPGVRYYYQIYAVNTDGYGPVSNTVSGRPGSIKPAAPTGISGYQGSNYASVYWNPVPGATMYALYMGTSSNGQGAVPIGFTGGTSYGVGSLTNFQTYYFKVTAITSNTQGARSVEVTVQPGTTRLTAVSLGVPNVTPGNVGLAWGARAGATSYTLFRLEYGGQWRTLATGLGTSYNDTTCIPGVQYTYYVCPVNAEGTGYESNQRTITAQ